MGHKNYFSQIRAWNFVKGAEKVESWLGIQKQRERRVLDSDEHRPITPGCQPA